MGKSNANLRIELDKTQPFESLEQEAYLNLVRTHATLASDFEQLFKRYGISQPLFNILKVIERDVENGYPSQSIGQYMIARDPDITRLVDKLTKLGLAIRERGSQDRRVVWVKITSEGLQKIKELDPEISALHQQQMSHMNEEQLRLLNELLVVVRQT